MSISDVRTKAFWLIKELGLSSLFYLAAYRFGIRSGYYRWQMPIGGRKLNQLPELRADIFVLPDPPQIEEWNRLRGEDGVVEAEEILSGRVRLFGAEPQPLNLQPPHPDRHWSLLHEQDVAGDIKQIWEPARLGWVFPLGRAYRLTGDERYPQTFWNYLEQFIQHNPVNGGENWLSAQEVALRLIALGFAAQVFRTSPHTDENRRQNLARLVVYHARRIEATLSYARAQNNNHLLSEAVGLLTAAHLIPGWHEANRWRKTGWKWFEWAILHQIEADGEYIQHSVNYHRLMLTLALLAYRIAQLEKHPLPQKLLEKLCLAAGWLRGVMDETNGEALHLGHHDGAWLIPLGGGIEDYRPVVQAAMAAFAGQQVLVAGGWDELSCWLGIIPAGLPRVVDPPRLNGIQRLGNSREWASLRAHTYTSRPAHADQLQMELFWRGKRLVCDAGSYSYNLPAPWQNALARAEAHNAPLFNHHQPMLRAGKFLWLQWDQAHFVDEPTGQKMVMKAVRHGYHRWGVHQERLVQWLEEGRWRVVDRLLPLGTGRIAGVISLNWLLRDGEWHLYDEELVIEYAECRLRIWLTSQPRESIKMKVVRAGKVLSGEGECGLETLLGWFSPTYLVRVPAISFWIETGTTLPFELQTDFEILPK
ncbi:MAG: heparinase II/III family protein [Chloroflexota bacterium]